MGDEQSGETAAYEENLTEAAQEFDKALW